MPGLDFVESSAMHLIRERGILPRRNSELAQSFPRANKISPFCRIGQGALRQARW